MRVALKEMGSMSTSGWTRETRSPARWPRRARGHFRRADGRFPGGGGTFAVGSWCTTMLAPGASVSLHGAPCGGILAAPIDRQLGVESLALMVYSVAAAPGSVRWPPSVHSLLPGRRRGGAQPSTAVPLVAWGGIAEWQWHLPRSCGWRRRRWSWLRLAGECSRHCAWGIRNRRKQSPGPWREKHIVLQWCQPVTAPSVGTLWLRGSDLCRGAQCLCRFAQKGWPTFTASPRSMPLPFTPTCRSRSPARTWRVCLVDALRHSATMTRALLIAEVDGNVVGHVFFYPCEVWIAARR